MRERSASRAFFSPFLTLPLYPSLDGTSITAKGKAVLAAALGRKELGDLWCVFVVLIYLRP